MAINMLNVLLDEIFALANFIKPYTRDQIDY